MQSTVFIKPKEIQIKANADVLVCGAGPSGIMAAISARRCGVSVILVEKQETLGGMATTGLVGPISEFNMDGKKIIGGLPWEFVERMHVLNGAGIDAPSGNVHFDPEIYKLIAHQMLAEAEVTVYLDTHVSDCIAGDNHITHVVLENLGTVFAVSADFFIDCTGNADLCALAKVPFQETPGNAELQPASLCFQLAGVDTQLLGKTYFQHQNTRYTNFDVRAILEELAKSEKTPIFGGPWFISVPSKDLINVNMTRAMTDSTDPESISNALRKLREDIFYFVNVLKKNVPAFKSCWLVQTAAQLGRRESRRIEGVHILTGEEFLSGKYFSDTIACSAHPVDVHKATDASQSVTFLEKPGYIPYRCLITKKYDNLIVAGRCISADRTAFASLRVQAPVMATGQAAGTAAALSFTDKVKLQSLDTTRLRRQLLKHNALI